jgi:hypothetical protein
MNRISDGSFGFNNPSVRLKEAELGSFEMKPLKDGVRVVDRPEVELPDGTRYIGQWNDADKRHGYGVLHWDDGAKYEGTW